MLYRNSLPITVLCITDLRITDFFKISFLVYNWFYLLIKDFVTAVNLVKSRTGPALERCTGAQCTVNFGDIRIKSLF